MARCSLGPLRPSEIEGKWAGRLFFTFSPRVRHIPVAPTSTGRRILQTW